MIITNALRENVVEYRLLQNFDFIELNRLLNPVAPMYPNFDAWLNFKFRRNLALGQRQIALANYGCQLAGVALLKNDGIERKICTFYIAPNFRNMGVGSKLMDLAIETLNSSSSFITVSDERKNELAPLLSSRGFKCINSVHGLYRSGSFEHFYSL